MTATILTLLALWTNWNSIATNNSIASIQRSRENLVLSIKTTDPGAHLAGLVMNTAQPKVRTEEPRTAVTGYYLDVGIFTRWKFNGSQGSDTLEFGPQGHIISKQSGGVVDFKKDTAPDVFKFSNVIDVKKCSEKHGIQCHPLNHLQQVIINNFGKEDTIILQGKSYKYKDIKNGVLSNVPSSRLKVNVIK